MSSYRDQIPSSQATEEGLMAEELDDLILIQGKEEHLLQRVFYALLPVFFLLMVWQVIAFIVFYSRGVVFPNPWQTFARFWELLSGGTILRYTIYGHLYESLVRWGTGFLMAGVTGISIGILMGWSSFFERLMMPIIFILQPIPSLAWIPVAILLLGLGQRSTIFIIFLAGVFPIVINMAAGVSSVNKMYIRAAKMLGSDDKTLFFKVLLPGAIPHLLSGFRVGLANGWRALIAAEMVAGAGSGLGYAIYQSRWNLDYTSAFVSIIVICIIGLIIERFGFALIEKRTIERWGLKRSEV